MDNYMKLHCNTDSDLVLYLGLLCLLIAWRVAQTILNCETENVSIRPGFMFL